MNSALPTILKESDDINKIQLSLYAAAVTVIELNGESLLNPQKSLVSL